MDEQQTTKWKWVNIFCGKLKIAQVFQKKIIIMKIK